MSPKGSMPPPSLAVMIGKEKGGTPPAAGGQDGDPGEGSFMCPACGAACEVKAKDNGSGNGMDMTPDSGGGDQGGGYGS